MQDFTPLSLSAAEKSVTVQKQTNKCVSRLARRIPHHTALSNAAVPSSKCPSSLVPNSESPDEPHGTPSPLIPNVPPSHGSQRASLQVFSQVRFVFPGDLCIYASGGAGGHAPWPNFTKGDKTCPDSRPTCKQNFTPLSLSAAEKSVTVQRNKNKMTNKITHSKLSILHTILLYVGITKRQTHSKLSRPTPPYYRMVGQ